MTASRSIDAWNLVFRDLLRDSEEQPFPLSITSSNELELVIEIPEERANEFEATSAILFDGESPSLQIQRLQEVKDEKEGKRSDQKITQEGKGDSKSESKVAATAPSEPPADNKVSEGLKIVKNLFGSKIKIPGAAALHYDDVFDVEHGAEAKNGVLISIPLDPSTAAVGVGYNNVITALASRLGVPLERLRQAYSTSDHVLAEVKNADCKASDHREHLLRQCFSVVTGANEQNRLEARVYINYLQIYRLLWPLRMKLTPSSGGEVKSTVRVRRYKLDKQHLLLSLQRQMNQKAIISGNHGIFLESQKSTAEKENMIYFVGDTSGSMGQSRPDTTLLPIDTLKLQAKSFFERIANNPRISARTRARLKFYSENLGATHEFLMGRLENIKTLIDDQKSYGATKSSGNIADVLQQIEQQGLTRTHNVFVVHGTDGEDNNGSRTEYLSSVDRQQIQTNRAAAERILNSLIELERKDSSSTRPRIVTLACGLRSQEGIAFYQRLADLSLGSFCNEASVETALNNLFDELERLEFTRQILTIQESLENEAKSMNQLPAPVVSTVPVYLNGEPQEFKLTRPFGENTVVYINGERFDQARPVSLPASARLSAGSVPEEKKQADLSGLPASVQVSELAATGAALSSASASLSAEVVKTQPVASVEEIKAQSAAPEAEVKVQPAPSAEEEKSSQLPPAQSDSNTNARMDISVRVLSALSNFASRLPSTEEIREMFTANPDNSDENNHDRERGCKIM